MKCKSFIEFLKYIKFMLISEIKFIFFSNDEKYVKRLFKKNHGYELNVDNPVLIDEKIMVNKYRDDSRIKKELTDKVTVRKYIKDIGLERILIYPFTVFNKVDEVDFSLIKEPMILKCSSNSGSAYKYYPGDKVDKWKIRLLDLSVKQNYYHHSREKNYDGLNGKIIMERILNPNKEIILDYKFFCFNGEIGFVFIEHGVSSDTGSHLKEYKRNIVDRNFLEIEGVKETRDRVDMRYIEKPSNWEDMCYCAETISKNLNFVRVDLYSVNGKTYFGETTFYHGSGNNKFEPEEFDLKFANKIDVIDNNKYLKSNNL